MMGLGLLWMLLFWGLLILLAVWLTAALFPTSPPSFPLHKRGPTEEARDILDQRYARGELSPEQYLEMRQMLGK